MNPAAASSSFSPSTTAPAKANLAWIGDSFPDTLNQRLTSAGFLTITRDDRQYALDHLGLPVDFRPSRATTIRIAQTLDADFVIVGSYTVSNSRIAVQAQVLEVNKLRLSPASRDSSELTRLFDVENAIAWKVARQIDPHFNVAQQTFLAALGRCQLSAFENYIRGTDAPHRKSESSACRWPYRTHPTTQPRSSPWAKPNSPSATTTRPQQHSAKIPQPTAEPSKPTSTSASPASTPPNTQKPNQPLPSLPADFLSPKSSIIRPSPPAVRATMPSRYSNAPPPPTPTTRTITTTLPLPCCVEATSPAPSAKSTKP